MDNKDIKPFLNGDILSESSKIQNIHNIFGIPSKSVCENTIIDLKKIIISIPIIKAIAQLSNQKKEDLIIGHLMIYINNYYLKDII